MTRAVAVKIPKGSRCDAYAGWHTDRCGAPVIERCKNLAVRIVKTNKPGVFSELWLCASCRFEEFEGKAQSGPGTILSTDPKVIEEIFKMPGVRKLKP